MRAVIDLREGSRIINIRVIGRQLDLSHPIKKDSMIWFHYQSAAGDAGIVRCGGIILPFPGAVFILPCRDRHSLHLCRQGSLLGPDQRRIGVILKYISICRKIGQLCVLCITDQRIGDVGGDIDGILCLRVVIADIAEIGEHPRSGCCQLVGIDR